MAEQEDCHLQDRAHASNVAYVGRDGHTVRCGLRQANGQRGCPDGVLGSIQVFSYGKVLRFPDGWGLRRGVWQQGREAPRRHTEGNWLSPTTYPATASCPKCGCEQTLDATVLGVVVRRPNEEPPGAEPAFLFRPAGVPGPGLPFQNMPEAPQAKQWCTGMAGLMATWYPAEAECWEALAGWFETASKSNRGRVYGQWRRYAIRYPEDQGTFARIWRTTHSHSSGSL